ncbi:MAG: ATP-binding protein [Defluviicoccus sp.]|nr:ATP-binding protein [Defluviicoccus sp.]
MQPQSSYPPSIRARVHDAAIERVSRFFNATLDDIFVELLQNARRASATQVTVSATLLSPDRWSVTVTDDGAGIADPTVILSFGESAWTTQTASLEDPAGMGFYALAKQGCMIASRPIGATPAPAWRARICPDAFLGKTVAPVLTDDSAPSPNGTAITFVTEHNRDHIEAALGAAARHYPLPVRFNGRKMDFSYFLDRAVHTEAWAGLTFGVYRDRYRPYDDPDVNFHGRTFSAGLPSVECITGGVWSVRADIRACPEFELVLPARKEPVVNDFLHRMREQALLAIYRAIAACEPAPRLSYSHHKRATDAGIVIQQPPPALEPWRPPVADIEHWHAPPGWDAPRPSALLMTAEPETHHGQAIWRAAERAGVSQRLFAPDRRLEGYPWYDALPRVTDFSIDVTHGERTHTVVQPMPDEPASAEPSAPAEPFKFDARPDAIAIRLHIADAAGRTRDLELAADVVFMNDEDCYVDDIDPLVTAGSDIDADEFAALIHRSFFTPSDDADADSHETQKNRFDEEAMRIALTLLASEDEGLRHVIAHRIGSGQVADVLQHVVDALVAGGHAEDEPAAWTLLEPAALIHRLIGAK